MTSPQKYKPQEFKSPPKITQDSPIKKSSPQIFSPNPIKLLDDNQMIPKSQFYQTTKFDTNTRLFGRESVIAPKKRIGGELTKIPRHRRTHTDSKNFANIQKVPLKSKNENSEEKVQIIENIENYNIPEEVKNENCEIVNPPKVIDKMEEKIDQQIKQAEELIAKVTQNAIEMEELDLDNEDQLNEANLSGENLSDGDAEKEIEVTIGEICKDIAILVTSDYHLFGWPLDMLPPDVTKGMKFSFLIKRNTNSEVLRKNTIYTQQNEIAKLVQDD